MKNIFWKILVLTIGMFVASKASADEVCHTSYIDVTMYQGYATCDAYNSRTYQWVRLSRWVHTPTSVPTLHVSEYDSSSNAWLNCTAFVPFSHIERQAYEVCVEITELEANFQVTQNTANNGGINIVTVNSTSTAANNTQLVNYKWVIDGTVIRNGSDSSITFPNMINRTATITLYLTDSEGNTDSIRKDVFLRKGENCRPGRPCNIIP